MAANRILVVEDDAALADGIAANLQYVGYEYMIFDDGKARRSILKTIIPLISPFLTSCSPASTGLRFFPYGKYNIPVIYMTARTDSASEIRGLRDGAEDYLTKPFDVVTLLVRMEKVLARTGKLNRVLRFSDYTVDTENRTVTHLGKEIVLKPLEFDVLVMLVRNKNRTVPRERLLNEIWGVDYFGGPRTVDVHIANIRRKLGLTDEIKTISKTGYRLEER